MEQFNTVVNQNLGWVHENKYVLPVISLFLGMYAALARPKLPNFVGKLFENPVFRLVVISYIIYRGNKDPQLSLMIAAAFLITMHMINKQQVQAASSATQSSSSSNNNTLTVAANRDDPVDGTRLSNRAEPTDGSGNRAEPTDGSGNRAEPTDGTRLSNKGNRDDPVDGTRLSNRGNRYDPVDGTTYM